MATITIESSGCRSCSLCVDECPVDVFELDEAAAIARVARPEDCIGCASCEYICPSRCLAVGEIERQRPFYRLEEHAALVARMLQQAPLGSVLTEAEIEGALRDVSVRLQALGLSITDTLGRGQRVVGRKAGELAAQHLPEMYEGGDLSGVLARLRRRFSGSFAFEAEVNAAEDQVVLAFRQCALGPVVRAAGDQEGTAVLCLLFHEYWAGLIGAFTGRAFTLERGTDDGTCALRLCARN